VHIFLSFGGSRTHHRIWSAIQDSGWEIRDTIFWLYGSGFPKSVNVGKAIEAQQWNGHGTALKPSHEPIVLARKPLDGTIAGNVLKHGVGGLNIEQCRVGTELIQNGRAGRNGPSWKCYSTGEKPPPTQGRFPANIIHDGSEEVLSHFPNTKATGAANRIYNCENPKDDDALIYGKGLGKVRHSPSDYGDSGSAARFFYCSKASLAERKGNPHPTVKPLKLMEYLVKLVKQPEKNLILDPFAGSGSTLLACQALCIPCIGIELEESYCRIIVERLSNLKA
jgi:site-specific DNA-methyltransferase (adenine-specific)